MVLPFASPPPIPFPWVGQPEGHLYFSPPGQCLSKCWSEPSDVRRPLGNQGLCQPDVWLIRCALRTRYVQLLSGFVDTAGGFAGLVLPLSKCLVNRDSESDRVFLGEGISFIDRESLSWAKLGHPCRVLSFESRARGYEADGNLLMSGCR